MKPTSKLKETIKQRIDRIMASDPTCLKDARVFYEKFGEWP